MTKEQMRLMAHLDQVGGWITLVELSRATPLAEDDDLFVPSVVARGWADHDPVSTAVRITNEGRSALEDSVFPQRR
jgi:hypothetical protein